MKIVVSGVGTDVGKTWLTVALTTWVRGQGRSCIALKPVESGGNADSHALGEASQFHVEPAPYRFEQAIGPHLAAHRLGVTIRPEVCVDWVERCSSGFEIAIVELAGGLLSPLSPRHTNADLLKALAPDAWIAVAVDRLGVLHDVKALLLAAQSVALAVPAVVLNSPLKPDASTGTNADELEALGTCRVRGNFLRGSPTEEAAQLEVGRLAAHLAIL